ncbi:MAG: hypothetical protein K9G43_10755 [Rhodobacteraceae bacterium]|nr:hypothetical protein [Paracoccaceae bacterium]
MADGPALLLLDVQEGCEAGSFGGNPKGPCVTVVAEALINFQKTLRDGRLMPPADVLAVTLATLDGGSARSRGSASLIQEMSA